MEEYHDSTEFDWRDDSFLIVKKLGLHSVEIQGNAQGLLSLAEQLIQIANGSYDYVLYDAEPGDLEVGSLTLQITKLDVHGRSYPKD